jgi:hypothetical protein
VRGEFGVSEAGPRGEPPKCGENSGFPKLDRGRNRPSAGKIRGFRSWTAGGTAHVRGKFGVSEAGPRGDPPKCGEFGVSESGPREEPPKCGEFGVSESGPREEPPKCGEFGVSESGPREEPPKCGEFGVSEA